jgi:hypothetical protein
MSLLLGKLRMARDAGGKPAFRQVWEAASLRLRRSPVGISEYFDYGIWHNSVTPARRAEFIGWRASSALDRELNAPQSRVLANDKLINHVILRSAGFPAPEPLATYTPAGRRIDSEAVLTNKEQVLAWLRGDVYPFYVKPISAGYGRGVLGVAGMEGERLRLLDGSEIGLPQFLQPFDFEPYAGMLFQRPLKAHPAITELTGSEAVSCVRFICFVTPGGPVLHTAFWKITVGRNMLDNFSHGDYGNCLGDVDPESGLVRRVISRMGPGGEISRHPGTGRDLAGFALPDWQRAVRLVYAASALFPGLRLQNWDVALCPEGPVLLELNTESELAVPQAISGRGLMDQRLRTILAEIGQGELAHRAAVAGRH